MSKKRNSEMVECVPHVKFVHFWDELLDMLKKMKPSIYIDTLTHSLIIGLIKCVTIQLLMFLANTKTLLITHITK